MNTEQYNGEIYYATNLKNEVLDLVSAEYVATYSAYTEEMIAGSLYGKILVSGELVQTFHQQDGGQLILSDCTYKGSLDEEGEISFSFHKNPVYVKRASFNEDGQLLLVWNDKPVDAEIKLSYEYPRD